MTITFTLASGSSATAAGPFNISGTTSSNVTYWIATGVTKTQLTNSHPVDTIYETITGGTIASTGSCNTTTTWSVTPTPTPTATAPACECLTVYNEADRNITFQYNRCSDGQLASLSVPFGTNRTVCVQSGTDITDASGLLTSVACGTSCTGNDDCLPCT